MSFTPLTGGGVGGAYQPGDKWGAQTAEKVRGNFNDHETRIVDLEDADSLAGLIDVGLTSPVSDGDLLTYDIGSGLWVNTAPPQVLTTTVNLTDSQIKSLPTTPITLVSAPAAGSLIWPSRILLMFKAGASAYTNINADGFLFVVINTSAPLGFLSSFLANESGSPGLTMLSDFLGTAGNKIHQLTWPWQDDRGAASSWGLLSDTDTLSTMVAASLEIKIDNNGGGILTGGTGGNVLRVVTEYSIVAAP